MFEIAHGDLLFGGWHAARDALYRHCAGSLKVDRVL